MKQDLCIFAHYDRDDIVDPYVFWYIEALKACGFAIVFVTTVRIRSSDESRLRELCTDVIIRDNIGHDFGSWSAGLQLYRDRIEGRLLLANDSVYGPIGSLQDALDKLLSQPADFYGMVESLEHTRHLQSWFLLFEPHVVRSKAFAEVFCQPPRNRAKNDIIRTYELCATTQLKVAGYKYRALHAHGIRSFKYNPTAYIWRQLIEQDHVPFLKVAMVREDPVRSFESENWRSVVDQCSPNLTPLIASHIRRTSLNKSHSSSRLRMVARKLFRQFIRFDDFLARRGLVTLGAIHKGLFVVLLAAFDFGDKVIRNIRCFIARRVPLRAISRSIDGAPPETISDSYRRERRKNRPENSHLLD